MQTILVAGGTRGIGHAITKKLLAEDHKIYAVYKESTEQANELAKKYKAFPELLKIIENKATSR